MRRALSISILFFVLGLSPAAPRCEWHTLTQNVDPSVIENGASVACEDFGTGNTLENHYWRLFDLDAMGVSGLFCLTEAAFGVEFSSIAGQELLLRAHCLDEGMPFTAANLEPVGESSVTIPVVLQTSPEEDRHFSQLLTGCCDSDTQDLLIEIDTTPYANCQCGQIRIGANSAGQTAPSYISAPYCEVAEPTDLAWLGFPDSHTIMVVHGVDDVDACNPDVELTVARGPGPEDVTLDWNGCPGYDFEVFRSDDCANVEDPARKIGETRELTWVDEPPPAPAQYYSITGGNQPPLVIPHSDRCVGSQNGLTYLVEADDEDRTALDYTYTVLCVPPGSQVTDEWLIVEDAPHGQRVSYDVDVAGYYALRATVTDAFGLSASEVFCHSVAVGNSCWLPRPEPLCGNDAYSCMVDGQPVPVAELCDFCSDDPPVASAGEDRDDDEALPGVITFSPGGCSAHSPWATFQWTCDWQPSGSECEVLGFEEDTEVTLEVSMPGVYGLTLAVCDHDYCSTDVVCIPVTGPLGSPVGSPSDCPVAPPPIACDSQQGPAR